MRFTLDDARGVPPGGQGSSVKGGTDDMWPSFPPDSLAARKSLLVIEDVGISNALA